MLKWTVLSQRAGHMETPKRVPKRRRSLTSSNKEYLITSTPVRKILPLDKSVSEITADENTQQMIISQKAPEVYASTLPKYSEDYSPSPKINSGQMLAMRGLLPDVYLENPRYLSKDFRPTDEQVTTKDKSTFNSSKMGDHTLDKLIDAILESGKKSIKRSTRRTMNLRRRTLLKTTSNSEVLSPSYTAADDPASDLSFSEEVSHKRKLSSPFNCGGSGKKRITRSSSPRVCKQNSYSDSNYFEVGLAMPSIYV